MSHTLEEFQGVLHATDFVVRVSKAGDGVVIRRPPNRFLNDRREEWIDTVAIVRGDKPGLFLESEGEEVVFIPAPEFAVRITLICLLNQACDSIHYPRGLIEFYDEEGEPAFGVSDLIEPPADEAELTREGEFIGLVSEAIESDFAAVECEEKAESLGMSEEYAACKSIYLGE